MSLSQIREYFNERVAAVDPSLKEWKDSFNVENIPATTINNSYHLLIGPSTASPQIDGHIQESFTVTLTVFKSTTIDVTTAFDTIMDKAHDLRMNIINHKNMHTFDRDIMDVVSTGINPEPIDVTNDNGIKVEINFDCNLYFII